MKSTEEKSNNPYVWKQIKTMEDINKELERTLKSREENWGPPQSLIDNINNWLKRITEKHAAEQRRIFNSKPDNIRFDGY